MTLTARIRLVALAVGAAAMLTAGCGRKKAAMTEQQPPPIVDVALVERSAISETLEATGTVRALQDVTLSAKLGGKVSRVTVREGDRVGKGAVVVQQETADYQNQVRSAQAAVEAARVRLSQARTGSRVQDVQSTSNVRQAEEAVSIARNQLSLTRQGARSQERRQAEAAVAAARANFENARTSRERTNELYRQGAVAKAALDADDRALDVARANLTSAEQQLALVREGARPEEIRVAENNLRAAEERLRQARADLQVRDIRREDIQAAEAALKGSQASLSMARQALADSSIRSPISGLVASRMVEPGQMVGAGTPLIRVYNPATVYFEATISETNIGRVKAGQSVTITSQAVSDVTFVGTVRKVYPAASTANRSFLAQIAVTDPASRLKPGMFGKAQIVTRRSLNQLIIPRTAIIETSGGMGVFVAQREKIKKPAPVKPGEKPAEKPEMIETSGMVARSRKVDIGILSGTSAQVLSGLADGDRVVTSGQAFLQDGVEVNVAGGPEEAE